MPNDNHETPRAQRHLRKRSAGASPSFPLVAISILNWNGWQDTLECLKSVRRLDYPNYRIVVVDNGSWNDSANRIKTWAEEHLGPGHVLADYTRETALAGGNPETEKALDLLPSSSRMVLIRNEENLGFAGGNNTAIHYALQRGADYVFLLNNDAQPDPDCLSQLVVADAAADAGMVGAVVLDGNGQKVLFGGRATLLRQFFSPLVRWQLPPPAAAEGLWESFFVPGSAMLIRADLLRSLARAHGEYLCARLFMYADEVVLSGRAHKAGYRSIVAARARVRHRKAASSGGKRNPLLYYYPVRNTIHAAGEVLPHGWKYLFHLTNAPITAARAAACLLKGRPGAGLALLNGLVDGYLGTTGRWKRHDAEVVRHGTR